MSDTRDVPGLNREVDERNKFIEQWQQRHSKTRERPPEGWSLADYSDEQLLAEIHKRLRALREAVKDE